MQSDEGSKENKNSSLLLEFSETEARIARFELLHRDVQRLADRIEYELGELSDDEHGKTEKQNSKSPLIAGFLLLRVIPWADIYPHR